MSGRRRGVLVAGCALVVAVGVAAGIRGAADGLGPLAAPGGTPTVGSTARPRPDVDVDIDRVRAHVEALQRVADVNGGNRAVAEPGYEASVAYVVDVLQAAGYEPRLQDAVLPESHDGSGLVVLAPEWRALLRRRGGADHGRAARRRRPGGRRALRLVGG